MGRDDEDRPPPPAAKPKTRAEPKKKNAEALAAALRANLQRRKASRRAPRLGGDEPGEGGETS
jgi:hypothetical protein